MRPQDRQRAQRLNAALLEHDAAVRPLPGIASAGRRAVLVEQMIDSMRRVEYAKRLSSTKISEDRADPSNPVFHPLKAAVFHYRRGNIDEAFWLVFLFVHFGRDRGGGWRYISGVYGKLGRGGFWDWEAVSADTDEFRNWLATNNVALTSTGGSFGNHRKYMSLNAYSRAGTGAAVETYVRWVMAAHGHAALIEAAVTSVHDSSPRAAFDMLYREMSVVAGFGRMGRFDYLAMLGKLGFAPIEPGRAYLTGATGPVPGAKLLFGEDKKPSTLDAWLVELDRTIRVGMQVLEDSLCNWQKDPNRYVVFRG